jgi:dihydropyrimidinase
VTPAVLIRGGEVVEPAGRRRADVRVAGGRIVAIDPDLPGEPGEERIDADGLLVLPGILDCHTHFDLESAGMRTRDDFASGSAAAAAGGVTTYMNFAPQERGQPLMEALAAERRRADGHTLVDYGLHMSFGTPPAEWRGELREVVAAGVTSFKVYTTYRHTMYYTRDWDWLSLMREGAALGLLVMVHAENDDVLAGRTAELLAAGRRSFEHHAAARPAVAETEAVGRGLAFCAETGCPIYFVHLSAPASVDVVTRARELGLPAYAESCAHHLSLDDSAYAGAQARRFVMTPPLRPADMVDGLVARVAAGAVHTSGSDHCGYSLDQRGSDADFTAASPGIPGVETLWPVLYTALVAERGLELEQAAALVTGNAAAVFGLLEKGRVAEGADADLVLFDPESRSVLDEGTLRSRAGYSPWHGAAIQGRVVRTIARGETVYRDGEVVERFDHGRFVACAPFDRRRVEQALPRRPVAAR